jgi:RNA polymerase sigma factor (sigma-70 family)
VIAAAMPRASPLASLFAALSPHFGGDGEPLASLDEDAIARLVEQARAGDTGARQTLYVQHVDRVYRSVRGMLRSDADAEDVTQDSMLTVLTSLHKYMPRAGARFAAWVMTIALNTARRRFRRRRPELTATGELPETPDGGTDPVDALDHASAAAGAPHRACGAARARARDRERALRRRAQRERHRGHCRQRTRDDPQDSRARAHAPGRTHRGIVESRWRNVMNNEELGDVWTTLQPTVRQRRRIDARVFAWFEARDTPLAAEWLGLFRVAPFSAIALVAMSAVSLATAPPLVWLARALM